MTAAPSRHLVLAGAGHAHLEALRRLGDRSPGTRVTLIATQPRIAYSGMLPGLVAGIYRSEDIHIDAAKLAACSGVEVVADAVVGLDLARKRVCCRSGASLAFDVLSLDIGSQPGSRDVPGLDHATAVRPVHSFAARVDALGAELAARQHRARIAVVGAGAAGVELLFALERRLRHAAGEAGRDGSGLGFVLVAAEEVLPGFPRRFRLLVEAALAQRGITIRRGARVVAVEPTQLKLAAGEPVEADAVLWATQGEAAPWLAATGLALDAAGCLRVDPWLRCLGRTDIFAAGDTASVEGRSLPKSGVTAVRAGPVLAQNLAAALAGTPLHRFAPPRAALTLLSTADGRAIGTRHGLTVSGAWVWWWKSRIDRRFVAQYRRA